MNKDFYKPVDAGHCRIGYLGHSGWIIKTQNCLLIFDYTRRDNNIVDPDNFKDEKVYVFASHAHVDHFDEVIYEWRGHVKDIKYILGMPNDIHRTNDCLYLQKDENVLLNDIEIYTLTSTDDGVGFMVKLDGLSIVHLGDHAKWCQEAREDYKDAIDKIAKNGQADIVFAPIAKGSGVRVKEITEGVVYAAKKLNAKYLFPMHGGGKEYLYREFAEEIKDSVGETKIVCAECMNQYWEL